MTVSHFSLMPLMVAVQFVFGVAVRAVSIQALVKQFPFPFEEDFYFIFNRTNKNENDMTLMVEFN
jgi:hypothetical protein